MNWASKRLRPENSRYTISWNLFDAGRMGTEPCLGFSVGAISWSRVSTLLTSPVGCHERKGTFSPGFILPHYLLFTSVLVRNHYSCSPHYGELLNGRDQVSVIIRFSSSLHGICMYFFFFQTGNSLMIEISVFYVVLGASQQEHLFSPFCPLNPIMVSMEDPTSLHSTDISRDLVRQVLFQAAEIQP